MQFTQDETREGASKTFFTAPPPHRTFVSHCRNYIVYIYYSRFIKAVYWLKDYDDDDYDDYNVDGIKAI